jgi:1-acyl-sn-glycerol-3-phosphate acyltransferase
MMAACERWLERGVPVMIVPEGSRSEDGNVKPFKDGAFRLAITKGCPVIPIAISGTARTLPKHGFIIKERVNCRVRVLAPVFPAAFHGDVAAMREHVRSLVISAL